MRFYRYRTLVIVCFFILFLPLIFFAFSPNIDVATKSIAISESKFMQSQSLHDPFVITSNQDFVDQGWPGSGTIVNPYILGNMRFDTVFNYACIRISNTTAYFTISNCVFEPPLYGDGAVVLHNVTHATLDICQFDHATVGVRIEYSEYVSLGQLDCSDSLIDVTFSSNVSIVESSFDGGAGDNIYLYHSNNVDVSDCTITNAAASGIAIEYSDDNNINSNDISDNSMYQIMIGSDSSNNKLWGNNLTCGSMSMDCAYDNGHNNQWDDSLSVGNWYSDYSGSGNYVIPGSAGSVDHYPSGPSGSATTIPTTWTPGYTGNVPIEPFIPLDTTTRVTFAAVLGILTLVAVIGIVYVGKLTPSEIKEVLKGLVTSPTPKIPVLVQSGYDSVGEDLKLGVKVVNCDKLSITNVTVVLDVPDALQFVNDTSQTQEIGTIPGNSMQSAIFWLKPLRCLNDSYGGNVMYRNAQNQLITIAIPPRRIVNICPMLTETERVDEVFAKIKHGGFSRNCSSFEFQGAPKFVFLLAEARLRGLAAVDRTETILQDGSFLGYACFVGEEKYGEGYFAAEIQASGSQNGGVLTLTVYSDDKRILSGFLVDVMKKVRSEIKILQEKPCPVATCAKCGANLNLEDVGSDRIFHCEYCGVAGKTPPWL